MSRLWGRVDTDPSGRVDTDPSGRVDTDPSGGNPSLGQPHPRPLPEASGRGDSLGQVDTDSSDPGLALHVRTADALPTEIRWGNAWHPIQHIALSWQLDLCWWGARVYRDYYKLLAGGMALVIYHDLLTDNWGIQRVYD